jgi:hypothetical protein
MKKLRKISPDKLDAISSSGQNQNSGDSGINMYSPGPPYPFTPYTPILSPVLTPINITNIKFTNTPSYKINISPVEVSYKHTF